MADTAARTRNTTGEIEPAGSAEPVENVELDTLALAYGIEPEFTDAHGKLQRTPAGTKRALLHAMGVCADSPEAIAAACEAITDAAWAIALPPVVVGVAGTIEIPVVSAAGSGAMTWRVVLEGGGERSGCFDYDALSQVEARVCGGRSLERRALLLPADLPDGYHRFRIDSVMGDTRLIVSPGVCWLPPAIAAGGRLSGIAVQLYLLRSAGNWGIGDYTDLRRFVELVASRGGDVVGLNPLHQMFFDDPENASPYSPASRLLLNIFNIDVTAIAEYATSDAVRERLAQPEFGATLSACRDAHLVDYSAVASLKLEMLRLVFAHFEASASSPRQAEFARYRAAGRQTLEPTYVFTALREFFAARDARCAAWQQWPSEYRDPASSAVAEFARENAAEITFVAWLQWVADSQLELAAHAAQTMRVGLYRDLAVGADPAGAEAWCNSRAVVDAARVGAPPDIYNPPGQNWGLPPFSPHALRDEGYASFIELVRANMRHAGGLRIDHVMALQHIYWIPQGAQPRDGAYVRYPLEDLVGILALESHRARCLIVGEDLGTVPAGFRERMERANILSYRVLFFERDDAVTFIPPERYPRAALAVLGSHDLPTLSAWWTGADIRLRERLGLFADAAAVDRQDRLRAQDRDAFVAALRGAGLLSADATVNSEVLFTAAHAFLARTPAALAVAQIDDITGESDPVNVPTTSDEHPNWRRRLSLTLEEIAAGDRFAQLFAILGAAGRLRDRTPDVQSGATHEKLAILHR